MTTAPMSVPGTEFNDFLFAPIGEDRNGMQVSLLSGLAGTDVDSSQEAAKLAQLLRETATKLKLGVIVDEKPVKLTVELPAGVHRGLHHPTQAAAADFLR